MQKLHTLLLLVLGMCAFWPYGLQAGNPDRQGEAGAYELLMNPWARSAGLHSMPTSFVRGVESMRVNVAGLARVNKLEVVAGHGIYLQGTDLNMNALGIASRVGKGGAIGISLMALDFGDIPVTTTDQPEGTGSTFSPNFFNIGIGYAYTFENKISVGVLLRGVSETIADLSAFGLAIDAGVQYVTGEEDNFKFGIALRNVGTRMVFRGEGLATQVQLEGRQYELTVDQRSAAFELPSLLNLGVSYDFRFGAYHRLTTLGNFTANSFMRDQLGIGAEYALNERFILRAAYKLNLGVENEFEEPVYSGLSAGASLDVPINPKNQDLRLGIDYAFRTSKLWGGTHNFGIRFNL